MIWWQPLTNNDITFLAEKNCTVVSHELAHEFLRQSNNKNYVELVHEIWTKHLFASLPFEHYDETFKKTDKFTTFSTIDTSEIRL
jgi:molybdopterin/thiamine biosynthesis adenylyltransferase